MYKHPEKTARIDEAPTLEELIEAAAAEAEAEIKGKKGSARGQLLGHEDTLLRMLEKRLPLRKQVEVLAKLGINVTAVSLRNFLVADFPEQWSTYLAITRRGQKKNRVEVEDAQPLQQAEATQDSGAGKRKEEIASTEQAKPAATGEDLNPQDLDESKFFS